MKFRRSLSVLVNTVYSYALLKKKNWKLTNCCKLEWLNKEIGVNPNDVFLMLAEGDSMYPTLKNGAMIMVNKHFNGLSDGIYVMRHEQNLLVKRLQMLPNGIIKVKSDNSLYEPWEINKENLDGTDIEIIGRVVWSGQRM